MKLTEQEIVCPLCRKHHVTIQENKKGRPYVFCSNLQIPLNFSTQRAIDFLLKAVDAIQIEETPDERFERELNE